MQEWAIVATAPQGSQMVVSCHPSEKEADTECERLEKTRPLWAFHVEEVVDKN